MPVKQAPKAGVALKKKTTISTRFRIFHLNLTIKGKVGICMRYYAKMSTMHKMYNNMYDNNNVSMIYMIYMSEGGYPRAQEQNCFLPSW